MRALTGPALQPGDERGTRLLTTQQAEHQVLGVGGDPVWHFFDRISQGLVAQFTESSDHARLLARPVSTDGSRGVEWFVPEIGAQPVVLSDAPKAVAGRLAVVLNDIDEFLAELRARGRPEDLGLREMIGEALQVPMPDHVVVIGSRPVLVAWGHVLRPPDGRRDIPRELADWSVLEPKKSPAPRPDLPPPTATRPIEDGQAAAPPPGPYNSRFVTTTAAPAAARRPWVLPVVVVAGLMVMALLAVVSVPGLRAAAMDWIRALTGDDPFDATSCWEARDPIFVGVDQRRAVLVLCESAASQVEFRIFVGSDRLCAIRMMASRATSGGFEAALPGTQPCGPGSSLPWQSFACTQTGPDLSCDMLRSNGSRERFRLVATTR